MADVDINILAVIVATVAAMAIGFIWFAVLSEQWLAASGRTREEIGEGPQASLYALTALMWLVAAIALAIVIDWARADTFVEGLVVGFLVWLGFVATRKGTSALFEQRSRELVALDVGHDLIVLLVIGVILAIWS